jgi:hypothetical protein
MSDPLVTYLNDHLGGADTLLPEIEADHRKLHLIAEKIGPGPSVVK